MPSSRAIVSWLAVLGFVAVAAIAQDSARELEVYLKNCNGSESSDNFQLIVLEGTKYTLTGPWKKLDNKQCTWLFTSDQRFNLDVALALVVKNGARTRCRTAPWNDAAKHAKVEFELFRHVLTITLQPDNLSATDYVREIRGKDGDVDCVDDHDKLTSGANDFTLRDAQLDIEVIRLPFYLNPKDSCGIFVNLIPSVFRARAASIGATETTNDERVAEVIARQANLGKCGPPTQSGSDIDVIDELSTKSDKGAKIHVKVRW
jgi:hypothetical protein